MTDRRALQVLALEPYYGGSHRAFLDGWSENSRHRWTVLHLPPHHWKWRMRHAGITLADQVRERRRTGDWWDVILASDMLPLCDFLALLPAAVAELPRVVYFHENQLTYPYREHESRDYHFALTNFTSALAADAVWFNSHFHRRDFLTAVANLLAQMPDFAPLAQVQAVQDRSRVEPPGIEQPAVRPPRPGSSAPAIVWAARWEHDKNPETWFAALDLLQQRGIDFRISVLGESFRQVPEVFAASRRKLAERIDQWGFLPDRRDYLRALAAADVFVSTAQHEFFGLTTVEAIAAGAFPLLPLRLSYPELLAVPADAPADRRLPFFYDGTAEQLANRLEQLARQKANGQSLQELAAPARAQVQRFFWSRRAAEMDDALAAVRCLRAGA